MFETINFVMSAAKVGIGYSPNAGGSRRTWLPASGDTGGQTGRSHQMNPTQNINPAEPTVFRRRHNQAD
jgi:hypothetical protein